MLTIEIARNHLKLPTNLTEDNFAPYIPDAIERYLRPILGETLIDLLWQYYRGTLPESEDLAEEEERLKSLIEMVYPSLSRFTFLVAAPSHNINVGSQGFTTSASSTQAPASAERVRDYKNSLEQLGWDGVEPLLRFLFKNREDYPEWAASNAYKTFLRGYIRTAERFQQYVDIQNSYLQFYRMSENIMFAETLVVKPLLTPSLYIALLSEDVDDELTDTVRKEAFDMACQAIALHAALKDNPNKYAEPAMHSLNALRDYLNANPEAFPEKFPQGTQTSRAPYPSYQNKEEGKNFVFGS